MIFLCLSKKISNNETNFQYAYRNCMRLFFTFQDYIWFFCIVYVTHNITHMGMSTSYIDICISHVLYLKFYLYARMFNQSIYLKVLN